mmetsp:Transcript_112759/g.318747  ORF Transcript_112759/g.318747 Transcript_112759/m.318747 type:complete len:285 (-) Transcript_112759:910-1764(-)
MISPRLSCTERPLKPLTVCMLCEKPGLCLIDSSARGRSKYFIVSPLFFISADLTKDRQSASLIWAFRTRRSKSGFLSQTLSKSFLLSVMTSTNVKDFGHTESFSLSDAKIMSSPTTSSRVKSLRRSTQVPFRMTNNEYLSWRYSQGLNMSATNRWAMAMSTVSGIPLRYQMHSHTLSTPDSTAISPCKPAESHLIVRCWCRCRYTWNDSERCLRKRWRKLCSSPRCSMRRFRSSINWLDSFAKASMFVMIFTTFASTQAHMIPSINMDTDVMTISCWFWGKTSP